MQKQQHGPNGVHKLAYSAPALRDLQSIYRHIAAESPSNAYRFVTAIEDRCELIVSAPLSGRLRADLRPGIRIVPFRRRVVIAYRVAGTSIDILRIFYGGQDYEAILAGQP